HRCYRRNAWPGCFQSDYTGSCCRKYGCSEGLVEAHWRDPRWGRLAAAGSKLRGSERSFPVGSCFVAVVATKKTELSSVFGGCRFTAKVHVPGDAGINRAVRVPEFAGQFTCRVMPELSSY